MRARGRRSSLFSFLLSTVTLFILLYLGYHLLYADFSMKEGSLLGDFRLLESGYAQLENEAWNGVMSTDALSPEVRLGSREELLAAPSTLDAESMKQVELHLIEREDALALINAEYPMSQELGEYTIVPAYPIVPLLTSDIELHPLALSALSAWLQDAQVEGFSNFFINSGYRTYEEQERLYSGAVDKSFVQKPGQSEHQTGLAVDIAVPGMNGQELGQSKEGEWLAENAWRHGFILRYPEHKSHITKIAYEPWHFRYVGFPHAYYMYRYDLSLEEYIQFLEEEGGYSIRWDGITYYVFYESAEHDMLPLLEDRVHQVSSDNRGRYIITIRGD